MITTHVCQGSPTRRAIRRAFTSAKPGRRSAWKHSAHGFWLAALLWISHLPATAQNIGVARVPASQQVTLRAENMLIPSVAPQPFFRLTPDGTMETSEYAVPGGKVLVITDVSFEFSTAVLQLDPLPGHEEPLPQTERWPWAKLRLQAQNLSSGGQPLDLFSELAYNDPWPNNHLFLSGVLVSSRARLTYALFIKDVLGRDGAPQHVTRITLRGYHIPDDTRRGR